MAILYELRLLFTQGEKEEYTRQELQNYWTKQQQQMSSKINYSVKFSD